MLFDEQGSSVLGSLAPADLFYSFQHPLRHLLQDGSESSRVEDPSALTDRAFQLKRAETELYARQEDVNQLPKNPSLISMKVRLQVLPYFSHVQCVLVHDRVMSCLR